MKILCACEESQRVMEAFRKRGHEAFSCDLQKCSGNYPQYHYQGDVRDILFDSWDMVIAFPPCTYLTKAGAANIPKDPSRIEKGWEAVKFFYLFYNLTHVKYIAIENPVPMSRFGLPKYTQIVQPYYFGDAYNKQTCLWLQNLPTLHTTNYVSCLKAEKKISKKTGHLYYRSEFIDGQSGRNHSYLRSKTPLGLAEAMADQWSTPINFEMQLSFF